MRIIAGLMALVLWAAMPGTPAQAGERPLVVVELFTSQGCSSCPPADEFLARLARRDDVLALSLHVDYWDYIGWPDTFARPEHTDRQKAYARAAGMRSIYTPQMIIAGKENVIGAKPMDVVDYIEMYRDAPARVEMRATRSDGIVRLDVQSVSHAPLPDDLMVMLVTYMEGASVRIRGGENAGKTIDYANIVTSMREIGSWDGRGRFSVEVPVNSADAVALFLQRQGPGEILGAVRAR